MLNFTHCSTNLLAGDIKPLFYKFVFECRGDKGFEKRYSARKIQSILKSTILLEKYKVHIDTENSMKNHEII